MILLCCRKQGRKEYGHNTSATQASISHLLNEYGPNTSAIQASISHLLNEYGPNTSAIQASISHLLNVPRGKLDVATGKGRIYNSMFPVGLWTLCVLFARELDHTVKTGKPSGLPEMPNDGDKTKRRVHHKPMEVGERTGQQSLHNSSCFVRREGTEPSCNSQEHVKSLLQGRAEACPRHWIAI